MKKLQSAFRASLESIDSAETEVQETIAEVGQDAGFAEDSRALTEAETKIESVNQAIDQAEDDVATLEAFYSAMEDAREVGMEAFSAQFAGLTHRQISKRYGIGPEHDLPSLECFHDPRQARIGTNVSMESLGETIKKVVAWVKAVLKKAWEFILDFFQKLTKNIAHIERRATALEGAAQKASYGADEADLGALIHRLSIDGEFQTEYNQWLARAGKLSTLSASAVADMTANAIKTFNLSMNEATGKGKAGVDAGLRYGEVLLSRGFRKGQVHDTFDLMRRQHADTAVFTSDTFPGDRQIVVYVERHFDVNAYKGDSKEADESINRIERAQFKLHRGETKNENSKAPTLSSDEVVRLARTIKKGAQDLQRASRQCSDTMRDMKDKLDKEAFAWSFKIDANDETSAHPTLYRLYAAFTKAALVSAQRSMSELCQHANRLGFDLYVDYLKYGELSHKKGAPGPTAAAA